METLRPDLVAEEGQKVVVDLVISTGQGSLLMLSS